MPQRSKILIVDDEPFNVDYLEQELVDLGYDTASASNGQQALERVAADPPDLVLLDVMMPVMDGFAACRRLKDDDDTRLIPVLIMTALGAVEDRIRGLEAGADDFLTKPVDPRELLARIQAALRLKHTVDHKLGQLHRIKEHFARFVPEEVRRRVADNPEAPDLEAKQELDLSVLFLDISGYTRLSQELAPEVLNALVERYFSAFLDRVQEGGGDINETAGDGFMAIFQDPDPQVHPRRAVEVSLGLLAAAAALNQEGRGPALAIHMGVNSGRALIGSTRFEGVRGTRWTFTASGPVTNLAARLSEAADAGQVLVGPETARRLEGTFPLASLGPHRLKNMPDPVDVYRVLDLDRA